MNIIRHDNNKPLWVSQKFAINFYKDTGILLALVRKDTSNLANGPAMFQVISSNNDDLVMARHKRVTPACKHCLG